MNTKRERIGDFRESISRDQLVLVRVEGNAIKVEIRGKLHAAISMREVVAVWSWKIGRNWFGIRYLFRSGASIDYEYDREDLWLAILEGINGLGLFPGE